MGIEANHDAVIIFVRNPVPGRVKTRLAREIGNDEACCLYQAMVDDLLEEVSRCGAPIYLFHDGDDSTELPGKWSCSAHEIVPQSGISIGDRMTAAFIYLFSQGRSRVALLGSDIPGLDKPILSEVFDKLDSNDVAIVPAEDGGYCLIALRSDKFRESIFQEIEWSTDTVLAKTLERISADELKVSLLESRRDIDTLADLERYRSNPAVTSYRLNKLITEIKAFNNPRL